MRSFRNLVLLGVVALAFACSPQANDSAGPVQSTGESAQATTSETGTAESQPGEMSATPEETQACTAQGGTMRRICLMGELSCVVPYPDAGKPCKDDSDCAGQCRYYGDMPPGSAVVGECQADSNPCGCFGTVDDGVLQGTLCVD